MAPQHAFILAGGQSKRFGSDKTNIQYKGLLLLDILIETLRSVGFIPIILGSPKPHITNIECLPDAEAFQGPLAAIAGAFDQLKVPRAIVIASDMPFITPDIIQYMWKQEGHVVHFESSPLPAIYTQECLPIMKQLLSRGIRSLWPLDTHISNPTLLIKPPHIEIEALNRTLININTEHDLYQVSKIGL